MRLTVGSATDVGLLRSLNEDSVLVGEALFAVADGMGGHQGGEVASARALEAFQHAAPDGSIAGLRAAVQTANTDVYEHARTSPELVGMGTTLCALAPLDDHRVSVVNVGDSRVYLLRAGDLFQISEDHSFVETLVREGRLTRAQAEVHPQRNVITRALGIEPDIEVDGWEVPTHNGDRFLLCSDGLFNDLQDRVLLDILVEQVEPASAAGRLIDAANAAGGRDNISCIVIDIDDVDPSKIVAAAAGFPLVASVNEIEPVDLAATTVDEPVPQRSPEPTPPPTPAAATRRSLPTWRTVLFIAAFVGVFVIAGIATVVVTSDDSPSSTTTTSTTSSTSTTSTTTTTTTTTTEPATSAPDPAAPSDSAVVAPEAG